MRNNLVCSSVKRESGLESRVELTEWGEIHRRVELTVSEIHCRVELTEVGEIHCQGNASSSSSCTPHLWNRSSVALMSTGRVQTVSPMLRGYILIQPLCTVSWIRLSGWRLLLSVNLKKSTPQIFTPLILIISDKVVFVKSSFRLINKWVLRGKRRYQRHKQCMKTNFFVSEYRSSGFQVEGRARNRAENPISGGNSAYSSGSRISSIAAKMPFLTWCTQWGKAFS